MLNAEFAVRTEDRITNAVGTELGASGIQSIRDGHGGMRDSLVWGLVRSGVIGLVGWLYDLYYSTYIHLAMRLLSNAPVWTAC